MLSYIVCIHYIESHNIQYVYKMNECNLNKLLL
nr:MAG TPA: hypothetical protein [Caudoviricetes sp.]